MMKTFFMGPLHVYRFVYISIVTSVLYSTFGTSLSPLSLTVKPQNFEYILSWEAGNNTQAPTYYSVMYMSWGGCLFTSEPVEQSINSLVYRNIKECSNITRLSCNLTNEFTNPCKTYLIEVKPFPEYAANYSVYTFTPYLDTCLGPPKFNISTCSDCVNVTVKILSSLLNLYQKMDYTINVKTVGFEDQVLEKNNTTKSESFYTVFEGLQQNTNYCVAVDVRSSVNKMCVPSPWKCIVTSLKDESGYFGPILGGIIFTLAFGVFVLFLYTAGVVGLKMKERPKVLEATHKLNYSLFDSHPEDVHNIQMIHEKGKTVEENSYDGESDIENDTIYTNHKSLGIISKSHSKADIKDTESIWCSSLASDCQIAEVMDADVEDSQYDELEDTQYDEDSQYDKKRDSATEQMFYSSEINSSSIPEPESDGCLNINLNTVRLEIPNTNWDTLTTFICQEDISDLQEPCIPDASEPRHFANAIAMRNSGIHDLSHVWQNYSGSEESESSGSEMVGEYMGR